MYEFRLTTPSELKAFYEAPAVPPMLVSWGLFVHGELKAAAGVTLDPKDIGSILEEEARPIAFFDVHLDETPMFVAAEMVRRMRDWLRNYGAPVWVQHDYQHPKAERLLRAIGFRPTGQKRRDLHNTDRMLEMWVRPGDMK